MKYPNSLQNVINELENFPGVGEKMAVRIALSLVRKKRSSVNAIIESLKSLEDLKRCTICNAISETEVCEICSDENRDHSKLMLLEDYMDLVVIENAGEFKGYYFIVEGLISPVNNIMPSDLKISQLIEKISTNVKSYTENERLELIFAFNPTLEGESTALYIQRELEEVNLARFITSTRLALGVPRGSDLDYIDQDTLKFAIKSRNAI